MASVAAGTASLGSVDPLTLHTRFDTGSVAKIVTGLAIAILEEEGALSPSVRLRDFLPEFPSYGEALRVEHLIHHESGLRNYFSLLYYMAGWHPRLSPSPDEVFDVLCHVGSLTFEPGSRYEYCDSNYLLLARIVERVTGQRFGAFVQSRIFDPLGMGDSAISDIENLPARRADGHIGYPMALRSTFELRGSDVSPARFHPVRLNYQHVGAEGLYASAADLALLARHILFPTLVSAETMRDRVQRAPRMRRDGLGYAYGLNVGMYCGRRFIGHDGQIWGYSASLAVFPDDELEIVCLTNRDDLGAWSLRSAVLHALDDEAGRGFAKAAVVPCDATGNAPRTLGRYLDPATARHLEMVERSGGQAVSLCGSEPIAVERGEDGSLRGGGLSITRLSTCGERPSLLVRESDGNASTFEPFHDASGREAFGEYEGPYRCAELAATFDVKATETGIRLRNRDSRRPSMDLDYAPTIRDFFWSRDPYPELSQLQFLRAGDTVCAFIYRDPDGDRREDFRFERGPTAGKTN